MGGRFSRQAVDPALLDKQIAGIRKQLQSYHGSQRGMKIKTIREYIETETPDTLCKIANDLFKSAKEKQDKVKAFHLWQAAMAEGNLTAKYSVAECLRQGEGVKKADPVTGLRYLKELVAEKYPYAQFSYARARATEDPVKAYNLLSESAASGLAPAYYYIGNMHASGTGVSKNTDEAIKWYSKSRESGDPKASAVLGLLYSTGKLGDVENAATVDAERGFKYLQEAARAGHPLALHNIGCQYLAGSAAVEQNYFKAAEYFHRASDRGVIMSMVNLGILHRDGLGVKRDPAKAKKCFALAAPHDKHAAELLAQLPSTKVQT